MLSTCLLLAALGPAETRVLRLPPPTLRGLCVQAPVVVLARPVDPTTPTHFTVLVVLRGKGQVKVGQRLAPGGLVDRQMQSFDEPEAATKKPRPRRIDQALLFLAPGEGADKGRLMALRTGYRLCTEDGRVLLPSAALGRSNAEAWLHVAPDVTWGALLARVRSDLAAVDRLHVLTRLGRRADRVRGLLDWLEKRRGEFGRTESPRPHDLKPAGWGRLGYQVFDWIFEGEQPEDCWSAVKLYASLNHGDAPALRLPAFSSPAGREFLAGIACDDRQLLGDRQRAVELLAQPITLWPAGGRRDAQALTGKEQEALLDRLRPLLSVRDEPFKTALVGALVQLSRPGKEQGPRLPAGLLDTLVEAYRSASPGNFRDELARVLNQSAPERYRELSHNPAGVCVCLTDLQYQDGELTFFLDLRTGAARVFEQPTLVLERPGTLGFIAETKRIPLPVLNLDGGWASGVGGVQFLAVRLDLARVITLPQPNPRARGKPAATRWRLRVEGSIGKGKEKQTWKSEARRIVVRPTVSGAEAGFAIEEKR
jgi:hypothetical protein